MTAHRMLITGGAGFIGMHRTVLDQVEHAYGTLVQ